MDSISKFGEEERKERACVIRNFTRWILMLLQCLLKGEELEVLSCTVLCVAASQS